MVYLDYNYNKHSNYNKQGFNILWFYLTSNRHMVVIIIIKNSNYNNPSVVFILILPPPTPNNVFSTYVHEALLIRGNLTGPVQVTTPIRCK